MSSILKPTQEQQYALNLLRKFVDSEKDQVFVLNGYAGTGKTSLIKILIGFLAGRDMPFGLMASTGRASKILTEKAGFNASTIHKTVYSLDVSELKEESKTKHIRFRIKANQDDSKTIYIIDESSMIADSLLAQSFTQFGTGSLLNDVFTYLDGRKVVFVGDKAQLPPINGNFSPALDLDYLAKKYRITGKSFTLKDVMRYGSSAPGLAFNAGNLTQILHSGNFDHPLKIKVSSFSHMKVYGLDTRMIQDYCRLFREYGYQEVIFIAYSNRLVASLNLEIRKLLYGNTLPDLVKGEILMVQQNNYKHNLYNGDHIELVDIAGAAETKAGLTFLPVDVRVKEPDGYRKFRSFLIKDYLDLLSSKLSNEAEFELTKDFMIRAKKLGIDNKKNPDAFLDFLLQDPYMNAIRARYGYAVTCHKAQGGEWNNVFIILESSLWNPNSPKSFKFQWTYTALTRSKQNVNLNANYAIT